MPRTTKQAPSDSTDTEESSSPSRTGGKTTTIKLPELRIERLPLRITGITPLIVHAWGKKALQQMRDKQQKAAKNAREAKKPEEDFEQAKYKHPKTGEDCVRALFFKNAIVSACRFAEDMKMTVLRGAMFVEGDYIPLDYSECNMREDTVRVGQGIADLRYRPEYIDWGCDIVVQYNASVLSPEQVVNLVRIAGFSVGLCEWRPEKDGIYGRFEVSPAQEGGAAKRGPKAAGKRRGGRAA